MGLNIDAITDKLSQMNHNSISRLKSDLLLAIFEHLPPAELIKIESVCKGWNFVLVRYDSFLWKSKIHQELAREPAYNQKWIRYWLSLLDETENENWKTIYRLWREWNHLNLKHQLNPKFISAEKLDVDIPQFWKLKLGEVERGSVTRRITTADKQSCVERICYTRGPSEPFEIENCQNYWGDSVQGKPVRFSWQPKNVQIRLKKSTRSEFHVLEEHSEHSVEKCIRIWDPRVLPQGPYLPFSGDLDIPGLWVIKGHVEFIGLCQRWLVIRHDDFLYVYEVQYRRWKNLSEFYSSSRLKYKWNRQFVGQYDFTNVSLNEGLLGIKRIGTPPVAELFHLSTGESFSAVQLQLCPNPGHESVEIRFLLSRFHLLMYDCDQLKVYSLLQFTSSSLIPCGTTKLPYVGREIRIEISDDGAFFFVTPTVHHGEVVFVDILKQSCTSYLLQNGYHGSRLLKGCWLVFQDRNHQTTSAQTKVIWSPIYT
jgi:hypothetical protein